jgi:beta-D-xylosidase 4
MMTGEDSRYILTASSPKHFLAYNLEGLGVNNQTGSCTATKGTYNGATGYPDGGQSGQKGHVCRYMYNNDLTDRDLVEYYLPQWNAVVTRGKALGYMCSYTAVNGVPSCASEWANKELMRDSWGFDGYVVSDCLALQVMLNAHEYIPNNDIPMAAAAALNAGLSYNCGCVIGNGTLGALLRNLTDTETIDENLRRMLRVLFKLGEFDQHVVYRSYGFDKVDTPENRAVALEAALQGAVLLKNDDGVLPLNRKQFLALLGPAVDDPEIMKSSYHGDNHMIVDHTPAKAAAAMGLRFTVTKGCEVNSLDKSGFSAALKAASDADVAVVFLSLSFQVQETVLCWLGVLRLFFVYSLKFNLFVCFTFKFNCNIQ